MAPLSNPSTSERNLSALLARLPSYRGMYMPRPSRPQLHAPATSAHPPDSEPQHVCCSVRSLTHDRLRSFSLAPGLAGRLRAAMTAGVDLDALLLGEKPGSCLIVVTAHHWSHQAFGISSLKTLKQLLFFYISKLFVNRVSFQTLPIFRPGHMPRRPPPPGALPMAATRPAGMFEPIDLATAVAPGKRARGGAQCRPDPTLKGGQHNPM